VTRMNLMLCWMEASGAVSESVVGVTPEMRIMGICQSILLQDSVRSHYQCRNNPVKHLVQGLI
jgi:hypothetical protein